MSNSKSDKPVVLKLIAGSVAASLIFTFAWAKQFFANLDLWYFTLIEGGLLAAFIVESIGSYRYSDEPNKDWKRHLVWILALACCAWAAGWSCGVNGKKMMYDDINKAKVESLYSDTTHLPGQIPQ